MMLRFLAYPRNSAQGKDCIWLDKDLNTERFREAPAEFGDLWIKALSSSTDSAFLTSHMSVVLDVYCKAVAAVDKYPDDVNNKDGCSCCVNRRAACGEILASTLRGLSFMTLVPESLETLVSLPPCFPVIVKAFKQLADRFVSAPEWRESLAAPLGYALMIFANATPTQYLWGHPGNVRARAAIQPYAAMQQFKHLCNSALKTLDAEDVPKIIVKLIELLVKEEEEEEGEEKNEEEEEGGNVRVRSKLLPVLLDTLGAIANGNEEFLNRLVDSTSILDIVEKTLSEKSSQKQQQQTTEKKMTTLMFKINAYRFVYFLL